MKLRAAADFAVNPNAAAVNLNNVFGDGEAQASAAQFSGAGRVHAVKAFKNARLIRFGNANSGVRHSENNFAVARFGADYDLAARQSVLQCIVNQVLQDFGEPAAVAGYIRHALAGLYGDGNLFFDGTVLGSLEAGFNELRNIDLADFELEPVRVHF